MLTRETGFGVFASTVLAIVALPLVACGETRSDGAADGASGAAGSGGSVDSGGATGGSRGGSNGVGGATGGNTATAGSSGDAGVAGTGGAGGGDAESASFHWIEASEEHRQLAAASTEPAVLRTFIYGPYDASVLMGTSDLIIGKNRAEVYTEGIVWTEATGTTGLGGLPGATPAAFSPLSEPHAVSADGSVVVGVARDSQRRYVPFRWTRADGMEALAENGDADAVSADGSVVVGVRELPVRGVFRWTRALGAVTIVEPLFSRDELRVLALSPDGATVFGESSGSDNDNAAARLFVWEEGAGMRIVENLPGYASCLADLATFSQAHGFVVGGLCWDEAEYEPFLWAGQDNLVPLGPADALGGYKPANPFVTVDGSVAVGGAISDANEDRAYRWTEANGFELIQLPQGYTSSAIASMGAMSEDGSVVVGRMDGVAMHSFLWSASAGAVVLSPLGGHDTSVVMVVSADGSLAAGTSSLGDEASTVVYWRADGVAHRVAEELAAEGIELGAGQLAYPQGAYASFGFFGYGSKDEVSRALAWLARLP